MDTLHYLDTKDDRLVQEHNQNKDYHKDLSMLYCLYILPSTDPPRTSAPPRVKRTPIQAPHPEAACRCRRTRLYKQDAKWFIAFICAKKTNAQGRAALVVRVHAREDTLALRDVGLRLIEALEEALALRDVGLRLLMHALRPCIIIYKGRHP